MRLLDPSKTYFWKWTWGSEVRLLVQEGIGGPTVYDYGVSTAGTYSPTRTMRFSARASTRPWKTGRDLEP